MSKNLPLALFSATLWATLWAGDWKDITPKPGFAGWSRGTLTPSKMLPATTLTEASSWSVQNGIVRCDGDKGQHEWLRYDQELGDFEMEVEWRFVKRDGSPRYNSGIFVRNTLHADLWHQVAVGNPDNAGFFFAVTPFDGVVQRITRKPEMKPVDVKPAGEWNRYRIRAEGRKLSAEVNGEPASELNDCFVPKGYVGLEAEGYAIEFRSIRVRELP